MAGQFGEPDHGPILGGACTVRLGIERAVRELYIQHQRILKTMPKTSVELLIVALITCCRP